MTDLTVTSWAATGDASSRCHQPGCTWPRVEDPSAADAADAAREHTRTTGHPTQSTHVQVTRYELDGTLRLGEENTDG